jgi:hypothetical protein
VKFYSETEGNLELQSETEEYTIKFHSETEGYLKFYSVPRNT